MPWVRSQHQKRKDKKKIIWSGVPVLITVILAIWEAEIGRIMVQGQFGQIVCETHLQNYQSKMD
jgi:hypothetical protein